MVCSICRWCALVAGGVLYLLVVCSSCWWCALFAGDIVGGIVIVTNLSNILHCYCNCQIFCILVGCRAEVENGVSLGRRNRVSLLCEVGPWRLHGAGEGASIRI